MKVVKKWLERCTVICAYWEEDKAVDYLNENDYSDISFYHMEDQIKVIGQKVTKVEKEEV